MTRYTCFFSRACGFCEPAQQRISDRRKNVVIYTMLTFLRCQEGPLSLSKCVTLSRQLASQSVCYDSNVTVHDF